MARSFSSESSSSDIPPRAQDSIAESLPFLYTEPTFEEGLEPTIPLDAVVREGKVGYLSGCEDPDLERWAFFSTLEWEDRVSANLEVRSIFTAIGL
jgi:hypothetical protein